MINTISSFTSHESGGLQRLSATYTQVDESTGQIVKDNERFNVVVVDDKVKDAIATINKFLTGMIPE